MNKTTNDSASAPRLDSFAPIHKAFRRQLFETAVALARADFTSPAETAEAARVTETCFTYLREHAEHEDRRVMPIVTELAPALADDLAGEHVALERAMLDIGCLFPKLDTLEPGARFGLGAELVRRFNAFVADQLRHMGREEREVNAVLWAHLDDAAIAAITARIIADIGPTRMAEMVPIILPALNPTERAKMGPPSVAA
ncbi:MAG TPA: hemerythrin domain-containing protein [Polyangia bacterium]|jgi:hypothetical protein|nr:hemerythrin domain-containing protein [Polyangia bacterium]